MNPCNNRFPLRPAAREEAGLFYSDDQADRTLGLDRPVGRVSFANGERMEFTAPQDYLRTIREELPTRDVTGFRFETLTDDPAVRKAAGLLTEGTSAPARRRIRGAPRLRGVPRRATPSP